MPVPRIVPFGGLRPVPGRVHPLVNYLLDLTGKPRPRVLFIPTATGDSTESLVNFYQRLPADRSERRHLALFNRTEVDLDELVLAQDLIWVGGGNTANALAVWRVHGLDQVLRRAWEAGVLLTGGSAGSLCWFQCGTTDSFNLNQLAPLHDGLGFLPYSHCPHFDGEAQRRPLYHSLIAGGFPAGYAIDDDAALLFEGTQQIDAVTARNGASAYWIERHGDQAREQALEMRVLSG